MDNEHPMNLDGLEDNQLQFVFAGENNTPEILNLPMVQEAEMMQDDCTFREHELTSRNDRSPPQQTLVGPLRFIDPRTCTSLRRAVEQLSRGLPLTEVELPEYIFRADMLDFGIISRVVAQFRNVSSIAGATTASIAPAQAPVEGIEDVNSMLDAAMLALDYSEGYPKLASGMPFWNQLDFESSEAYQAFINYIELGGARQLSSLISYDLNDLQEWFHLHYWSYRVKAYDMFRVVNHHKMKLQRMLLVEDDHYEKARRIMKKLDDYVATMEIDDENMTPDRAVAMLEKLVKIQRISVGLPAQGESKENPAPRMTVNVQQLMQEANSGNRTQESTDDPADLLMDDPDSVELAQELIIRMQKAKPVN